MKKRGSGWLLVIMIVMLLALLGSCDAFDSDYEKAGKEFGSWINTDPNKWTDTQKDYFNNFMDWADKH